jgi:hypothetical protein
LRNILNDSVADAPEQTSQFALLAVFHADLRLSGVIAAAPSSVRRTALSMGEPCQSRGTLLQIKAREGVRIGLVTGA